MFVPAFIILSVICAVLSLLLREQTPVAKSATSTAAFQKFQVVFLTVFLIMNAGDWLQGPYVYALYQSYKFNTDDIAMLFVAGFLSSAIFGTVIGSVADTLGRKRLAIVFAVVYSISCVTKLSPNFSILMIGRLLAGIATSLLFSVFEAWMVCEHTEKGYDPELLSQTFSWATWGNGLVAILSGVSANFVADSFGIVAPFLLALVLFIIGGIVVILTWSENYGQTKSEGWLTSLYTGIQACRKDVKILALGAIQSLFESAMYSFVFIWTPALQRGLAEGEDLSLPFGWIFSAFMVAVMIGSLVFGWLTTSTSPEVLSKPLYFFAALTLLVPVVTTNRLFVFCAFIAFECCCGFHFPLIGTLRSRYIPEDSRAAVMNLVRVPLNLIVVIVLLKVGSMELSTVFSICGSLLIAAGAFTFTLPNYLPGAPVIVVGSH